MQAATKQLNVAVVGAGMGGSACAQALVQAGHAVHVFDKSRGPGGRMATRALHWTDNGGLARLNPVDHGVSGFAVSHPAFRSFVRTAGLAGQLLPWSPVVDATGWPLDQIGLRYVPVPDMPQLCQHLLTGATPHWHHPVQALQRSLGGWRLLINNQLQPACFDAVMLALPPAQAAVLLAPHHREWAQRASLALMQPCWTLMGVAGRADAQAVAWQVARPTRGPLAWLERTDTRPGRTRVAHQQSWVAHSRPAWSRAHLEEPAAWVQAQLQAAVADWLGHPVDWQCALVHRWRYAMPSAGSASQEVQCWWNTASGLGVCGDFLGGQGLNGVESAWLSGHVLAQHFLVHAGTRAAANAKPAKLCTAALRRGLEKPRPAVMS
jgi:renalase